VAKKLSKKQEEKRKAKQEYTNLLFSFFMDIWQKREHYSEVSGRWLGKEARSFHFHHILPKSKYPEAAFDEDNIILLTFEEHGKVENNPTFYEEVNRRREILKEKYDRSNKKGVLEQE
jgi:hypothetical protein